MLLQVAPRRCQASRRIGRPPCLRASSIYCDAARRFTQIESRANLSSAVSQKSDAAQNNRTEATAWCKKILQFAEESKDRELLSSAIQVAQFVLKGNVEGDELIRFSKLALADLQIDADNVVPPSLGSKPCDPDGNGRYGNWIANVYWRRIQPIPSNSINQADLALRFAITKADSQMLRQAIVVAHRILRTHDTEDILVAWEELSSWYV
mmetsp:Transcript_88066/g.138051  ORF Transcript_88066/g.138051 Transcript_88066/m.138051 type:complete len:209 (+) Transcript_88066:55-681(+)